MNVSIAETRDPGEPKLKYEGIRGPAPPAGVVSGVLEKADNDRPRRRPLDRDGDDRGAAHSTEEEEEGRPSGSTRMGNEHADSSTTGNIHGMPARRALGRASRAVDSGQGADVEARGQRSWPARRRMAERANIRRRGSCLHMRTSTSAGGARSWRGASARVDRHRRHPSELRHRRHRPHLAPGGATIAGRNILSRAHLAMEMLATGLVMSAEIVEVNPILDHRNNTPSSGCC